MLHHVTWVRDGVAAALALGMLAIPQEPPRPPRPIVGKHETFVKWVDLGVPAPGVWIAEVSQPTMPTTFYLSVRHAGRRFTLHEASQLVGLVRIETPQHALRWAQVADGLEGRDEIRHRTTPPAWYAPGPYPPRPGDKRERTYSTMGELTARDMHAGGFSKPVVEQRGAGFVLTRWVYEPSMSREECFVERLRETIGPDGAIERTVLARRKAPDLPEGTFDVLHPRM